MNIHPGDLNGQLKNKESNLRRPGYGWMARGKDKDRRTARYIIQQRLYKMPAAGATQALRIAAKR